MIKLDQNLTLIKSDCLTVLRNFPDQSIDAIITDPPYFRVKENAWDRQWKTVDEFFAWLEEIVVEFKRILKPNGSLYLFCGPYLASWTELLIDRHLRVLNHIIWVKRSGRHNGCQKSALRKYFPQTESVIFAESRNHPTSEHFCCEPVRQYLVDEWKRAGLRPCDAETVVGSVARHYFSRSQWALPTFEKYEQLKARAGSGYYEKRWSELKEICAGTDRALNVGRRYFAATTERPFTNVWNFDPVQFYQGKHPCEKPAALMSHIIETSTRPGDLILDAFLGSGSTAKAAISLGRRIIGIDMDDTYFDGIKLQCLQRD